MATSLESVQPWKPGGRASAGGFNAVLAAVRGHRRSLVAHGFMDSSGVHSRPQPRDSTADLNPVVLGRETEGSETASTDSWDIADQADGESGASCWITTGQVYNEAGDQVIYEFRRLFTFDGVQGGLVTIGAETRVSIDTTEPCS